MSLLIVKAAEGSSPQLQRAIDLLSRTDPDCRVIDASQMDIRHCKGCYVCMLNTPGVCAIRDDYPELLRAYVQADDIIFLMDTALDFVNYKSKNLIDRMFPFVAMLIEYVSGENRHVPRYPKQRRMGMLYSGTADQAYLNLWTERVALNMQGTSLGAWSMEKAEELCAWILS